MVAILDTSVLENIYSVFENLTAIVFVFGHLKCPPAAAFSPQQRQRVKFTNMQASLTMSIRTMNSR